MTPDARSLHHDRITWLDAVLRQRIHVTRSAIARYEPRQEHPDNIQPAPKLLLIHEGGLTYTLHDEPVTLRPGSILYRPAPSVSRWLMGRRPTTLVWVEFEAAGLPGDALVATGADPSLEWSRMTRIHQLLLTNDPLSRMEAEAELKSALGRFFSRANRVGQSAGVGGRATPAVRRAIEHLSRSHHDPAALSRLPQVTNMSPAHFRRLFRAQVGVSARTYLTQIRLRVARYQVQFTNEPIKQIARRTGYRDPLFFSRHYHAMFGISPTDDRASTP